MKVRQIIPVKLLLMPVAIATTMMLAIPAFAAAGGAVEPEPDVEILMENKAFKVIKGGGSIGWPAFGILAGKETTIKLTNQDEVAHEFVSPMFRDRTVMGVEVWGRATTVYTPRAAGFRLDPGESVLLRFVAPRSASPVTSYDLFWCNVHGTQEGDKMRGEMLVVETRGG